MGHPHHSRNIADVDRGLYGDIRLLAGHSRRLLTWFCSCEGKRKRSKLVPNLDRFCFPWFYFIWFYFPWLYFL